MTVSYMPAKYRVTQPDVIESNEGQKEMDDARRHTLNRQNRRKF
ncbi:MAG: hypothetical protein WBP83_11035 [Nitrososphaeraceae archaeon]